MKKQLKHSDTLFEVKEFPITLLLDNVSSPANLGSLFRLADAFNIEKILICGKNIDLSSKRLVKTARSTIEKIEFEVHENAKEAIKTFSDKKDFAIFALEITNDSLPIDQINFSENKKVLLIVGNEAAGIDEELLELSEKNLHIKMYGHNSSMNLSHATGIALHEITKTLPQKETSKQ